MDMGCYASSIINIFCDKKIFSKKIILKKNIFNMTISVNFIFDFFIKYILVNLNMVVNTKTTYAYIQIKK